MLHLGSAGGDIGPPGPTCEHPEKEKEEKEVEKEENMWKWCVCVWSYLAGNVEQGISRIL